MTASDLLSRAAGRGVSVYLDGSTIRYRGPQSEVAEVLPAIRQHKDALLLELAADALRSILAPACNGVTFADGGAFTAEWFAAQLTDAAEVRDILSGHYSVEELNAFARCFAFSPWPLIEPAPRADSTGRRNRN